MSSVSEDVDRLTTLPDEVLSHILSLMPTRFAVKTSVLSKRWRYSWTLVPNLVFDDTRRAYDLDSLTKFVDHALKFHKSSQVKLFRLNFSVIWVRRSSVLSWIDEAIKLNVQELDVRVIMLEFPLSMLTCKTLTKLRLRCRNYEHSVWTFPCSVNLPCLKTLDIAVSSNPFSNAFKLIHGCPVLENLSLEVAWRNNKEDYIFNVPTLKRLKLSLLKCVSVINNIVLNLPNLEYISLNGRMCSHYVMEDVSSLVEACVSFHQLTFDYLWVELLKGLSGVKSLSFQIVNSLFDFEIPFTLSLPVFPNLKHLKLENFWHSEVTLKFLESSPELKHLCIVQASDYLVKPEYSDWIEPKLVPVCLLTNLTTIKFPEFKGKICDIGFLAYLLRNANFLKTVTVTWENSKIEEETRVQCAELLKLPRASGCCEINLIPPQVRK
ncbi:hypothetical protein QVD17_33173 [Tagetes erecta]|uniref:F-box domain-containing protein n=1 Tax=Tagetes erecta TaxID=13708 RepID=A0AAD8JWB5_TARER|nr:hypothetical protein QVD17_33173 [Tagetes erecta]